MDKYRILKQWDDNLAEWSYYLQVENKYRSGWDTTIYNGDEDWANRQKEHYQCEVVEEKPDTPF